MTTHRILVVDDEPLNRDYLEQELEDRGYDVISAADGRQALELVAVDPPEIILLDVVMPRLDGIEVCRRLKDDPETRLIPIIIMTALTAQEDRVRGSRSERTTSSPSRSTRGSCPRCDAPVAAVFRGVEPTARARAAADAARSAAPAHVAIGIAVGSALIGSERIEVGERHHWQLTAEGPAVTSAFERARAAAPGQVLAGDDVRDQLGTAYPAAAVTTANAVDVVDLGWTPAAASRGVFELEFPADYSELLQAIRRTWEVKDLYLTRALSGLSGARVYAVDIDCAGHSGQAILKLERVNPAWDEEQEADRHRRAVARNEAYAAAHLSACPAGPPPRRRCRDAVDDRRWRTRVLPRLVPCALRATTRDRTAGHARHPRVVGCGVRSRPGLLSPAELLDHWLSYRLDPVEGRLDALLRDELGLDPHVPTFLLGGHWYPNPLAFARGTGAAPPLRAAIGQTHGDLHGFNVLTSHRRTDVSDYFLIDLAFYVDNSFLLFDQGYFELAYLLRTREDADTSRWIDLLGALFRGGGTTADDVGVVRLVEAARDGTLEWISAHEDHRHSYMVAQMILGRIGAGLNFANKRIDLSLRLNSLLYASMALKQYVKMHELDWPRTGQVLAPPHALGGGVHN